MKALLVAIVTICVGGILPALASPKDELMAADRAFAQQSVEKGYDQAYIANLATDGQTFTGAAPIKSKAGCGRPL